MKKGWGGGFSKLLPRFMLEQHFHWIPDNFVSGKTCDAMRYFFLAHHPTQDLLKHHHPSIVIARSRSIGDVATQAIVDHRVYFIFFIE